MITLVLADDHPLARAGIRSILDKASDIRVVGEAEDGFQVKQLVIKYRPQVLLLDLKMPGLPSAEIERWVRANYPGIVTLILTAHDRDAYLAGMIEMGAAGYLVKNESAERLIGAIRRAVSGERLFTDDQLARAYRWHEEAGDKWQALTRREREVIKLLVDGLDNASIAEALAVEPKTVAYHVTNILRKLGVGSRQEVVAWTHKYWPDGLE